MKIKLIPASKSDYPPRITKDLYEFYVDANMVGKVKLIPAGRGGWYLANFFVYKKYRNKGYGNFLMESILKLANQKKKKSIFLWTDAINKPAIAVYEKFGFKLVINDQVRMYLLIL